MEQQIKVFNKAVAEQMELITNTLKLIKGIGPIFSAGIIAEIGDINRFPNQAALAKYAHNSIREPILGVLPGR